MLLSLVIRLQALQPAAIPANQGLALYDVFLKDYLGSIDQDISKDCHDVAKFKPFTISTLRGAPVNRKGEMLLKAGEEVDFRITTLSEQLSKVIRENLLVPVESGDYLTGTHIPVQLTLAEQPFKVLEATLDPTQNADARQSTYTEILQKNMMRHLPGDVIRVRFFSPTSFHSEGKQQIFPLPKLVFGSWLDRWNYAITNKWDVPQAWKFEEEIRKYVEEEVAVNGYNLHSEYISYGAKKNFTFRGWCSFCLLDKDPFMARVLLTLADYAFFCGTGQHPTYGHGQTYLFYENTRSDT
jgi:CRISPR-associated endoribonuclease Cas6